MRTKASKADMSPPFATLVISVVILQDDFMQKPSDLAAGIETTTEFKRFSQKNDVCSRAFWDSSVRTDESDAFFPATGWKPPRGGVTGLLKETLPCAMPVG